MPYTPEQERLFAAWAARNAQMSQPGYFGHAPVTAQPVQLPPALMDQLTQRPPTAAERTFINQTINPNYVEPAPHKKKKKKGLGRRALELPFKAVREVAKPIVKNLPKGVRNALPAIGAIGGTLLGGPLGGMLGGALGGSARGGRHVLDRSLGGAAMGGFGSLALSGLGGLGGLGAAGAGGAGGLGGLAGAGASGAGAAGAGAASSGLLGSSGLLNSLIGGGGGLGTLLNTGLLATAIGGGLKAKKKKDPRESETLQDAIDRSRGTKRTSTSSADWNKPLRNRNPMKQPPKEYRGTYWNYFPTPQEQEEQLRRVNEEIAQEIPGVNIVNEEAPDGYAHGGFVEDYYNGKDGGQSDKRLVKVRPKSYIVNSTTVSLAGDGNSENGAKMIKNWAKSFQNGHFFNEDNRRVMKAYVSDGELKLRPEEVMGIGDGDIDNGVRIIKKMEKRLRKHKGVNKFLPPKSKSLDTYAGIKR